MYMKIVTNKNHVYLARLFCMKRIPAGHRSSSAHLNVILSWLPSDLAMLESMNSEQSEIFCCKATHGTLKRIVAIDSV